MHEAFLNHSVVKFFRGYVLKCAEQGFMLFEEKRLTFFEGFDCFHVFFFFVLRFEECDAYVKVALMEAIEAGIWGLG
jgi:hypothetical protein